MNEPIEILLLCNSPERAHQWTLHLSSPGVRVWEDAAAVPGDVALDVLVTDCAPSGDLMQGTPWDTALADGEIGVVVVGGKHPAGVCLPDDFTARELCLACSLLAETVRLRRQLNRSRRAREELNKLAMTDALTGLPNRRAWDSRLQQIQSAAGQGSRQCGIALLDLDHFKHINGRFGHLAGDRLLCHVAAQLASIVDKFAFAARLGGDEFGVLLDGTVAWEPAERVERIRSGACAGAPHPATASIGLAVTSTPMECDGPQKAEKTTQPTHAAPGTGQRGDHRDSARSIPPTPRILLEAADRALRQAKKTGRNRSVVVHVDASGGPS